MIVQEALDVLMKEGNQTIIAIAHRLSTIRNADMIAVIQGGKVVETGKHSELLEKEGAYHDLIEAQSRSTKRESITASDSHSESNSRRSSLSSNADNLVVDEKEHLLSFHNVHFQYPSRPEQRIFHGLDLRVEEGETLALVGPRYVAQCLSVSDIKCVLMSFHFAAVVKERVLLSSSSRTTTGLLMERSITRVSI